MAKGKKTGGRVLGSTNKVTKDIKALAQNYGPAAITKLAQMAGLLLDAEGNPRAAAESEATQAIALKELLDRGFGKSTQLIAGDEDEAPVSVSMKVKFVRPPGTGS